MEEAELRALPLKARIDAVVKASGRGTQDDFAERVGTTRERVNSWVRGRNAPSQHYAEKIAAAAELPVELFLEDDTDPLLEVVVPQLDRIEALLRKQEEARSGDGDLVKTMTLVLEEFREQRAVLEHVAEQLALPEAQRGAESG